ncbi:MAG: hypothetical protein RIR79_130 [Pseudomonadota bacterium]|jgi:hypothetical protein
MKSIAILHEGNDKNSLDAALIKKLLKNFLGLTEDTIKEQVEFYGMGIKSNFFKTAHLPYKKLQQYVANGVTKKILFIIDADDVKNDARYGGFKNTESELNSIIEHLGLQAISSVYIMHDPNTEDKTGYVESFLLSTLSSERMGCIMQFLICCGFELKEGDKSVYQRIFDSKESLAHPFSPYNFDHENYNELKNKLKALFE